MFLWSSTLWSHMLWTLLLLNPLWNWKGLLLQGIFGEEGLFHPQACNNMTFMVPAWENFYMLLHSLFPSQHARSCKLSWMTRIWLISWAKVHHVAAVVWAWPSAFIYVIFLVFAHCYIEQTQPIDFLVEFFHLSMNPVLDSWKKKRGMSILQGFLRTRETEGFGFLDDVLDECVGLVIVPGLKTPWYQLGSVISP